MSVMSKKPALEPAAGFSLESKADRPDRVPLKKGEYSIASRAIALSSYFLSGALAINLSQFLGSPLYLVNEDWYNAWIAFTKQSFGLLTMTLTQTFAPTKVIVSGDASVRGQLLKSVDGNLILDFPERLILIANHQIYTDWLYLWWIAYCNGMHGRLYIILKESLKKIPILGWGMQFNQFIFLKRNWEQDRPNMASALQKLNKATDPMWLLLFPEGTNLAASTRAKSAAWAKKTNMTDMQHVLLPRSTGLHFCLDELRNSLDYVYDCTVAYEGVPRGQYAQDIFTLKAGYLEGRPPKSVSMYWRRFAVKDIPLHNDKAFELWLIARWREKDILMEHYLTTGSFPADKGATKYRSGKVLRGCGHMEVPIQASRWYEFLQIFAPMGILAMVLFVFYGDLPKRFWKSINKQALQSGTEDIKNASLQAGRGAKNVGSSMSNLTLDSFFDPSQQEDTFKSGAMAVQKLLTSSSAQNLLNRADFMQQFLSDPQKMVNDRIINKQTSFMQTLAEEEARRQQNRISAPPGSTKPVTNGAAQARGAFWDAIDAEEKSRHGAVVPTGQKASFWDALDAEEKSRGGSVTSRPQPKGTFWQDLKAAEGKKSGDGPAKKAMPKSNNFWDAVKAEENSRYGTIVTLSSNASTAVGSLSSATSKSSGPPKLGPRKPASSIGPGKTRTQPSPLKPTSQVPQKAKASTTTTPATTKPSTTVPKAAPTAPPVKQPVKATSNATPNKAVSQTTSTTANPPKKLAAPDPTAQGKTPAKVTSKPPSGTPKPASTSAKATSTTKPPIKISQPAPKLPNPVTKKADTSQSVVKKQQQPPPVSSTSSQPVKKAQTTSTTPSARGTKTNAKPLPNGNSTGPPKLKS